MSWASPAPEPATRGVTMADEPRIITARKLGLAFVAKYGELGPERNVTGHYSAGARARNWKEGVARARSFHADHRDHPSKRWGGLAYHFIIADDGSSSAAVRPCSRARTSGATTPRTSVSTVRGRPATSRPASSSGVPMAARARPHQRTAEGSPHGRRPAPGEAVGAQAVAGSPLEPVRRPVHRHVPCRFQALREGGRARVRGVDAQRGGR